MTSSQPVTAWGTRPLPAPAYATTLLIPADPPGAPAGEVIADAGNLIRAAGYTPQAPLPGCPCVSLDAALCTAAQCYDARNGYCRPGSLCEEARARLCGFLMLTRRVPATVSPASATLFFWETRERPSTVEVLAVADAAAIALGVRRARYGKCGWWGTGSSEIDTIHLAGVTPAGSRCCPGVLEG